MAKEWLYTASVCFHGLRSAFARAKFLPAIRAGFAKNHSRISNTITISSRQICSITTRQLLISALYSASQPAVQGGKAILRKANRLARIFG